MEQHLTSAGRSVLDELNLDYADSCNHSQIEMGAGTYKPRRSRNARARSRAPWKTARMVTASTSTS